jgi:hypothetical protein
MSTLAQFSQWISSLDFFTALRESALAYPVIMSLHLTSIAVFGGLILMTDLRLLGLALPKTPVSDVIAQTRLWKRIGFVVMVTCGVLLAGAKLDKYYDNPYFQLKLLFLTLVGVHALVFHRSVYGNASELDRATAIPAIAKAAACLSLVLWIGILSFGRWIAYYERPGQVGTAPAAATQSLSQVLPSR